MVCSPKQFIRFIRQHLLDNRPLMVVLENNPEHWVDVLDSLNNYYRFLGGSGLVYHITSQTSQSIVVEVRFLP